MPPKVSPTIQVSADHDEMSRQAARHILDALSLQPNLLLTAAGGATPLRTYELLVESYHQNPEFFRRLRLLKLDEWGDLTVNDAGSCEAQLRLHLIDPLKIPAERYIGFDGAAPDPEAECERIRQRLAVEGPIDLCVLGLGLNGHIGLNEPGPILHPEAHVAQLTDSSMRHPMLAGSPKRPSYGLTLGMADLLASRRILLLVSGTAKRAALQRLLVKEISTDFPASFLWLHSNWMVYCDQDAANV